MIYRFTPLILLAALTLQACTNTTSSVNRDLALAHLKKAKQFQKQGLDDTAFALFGLALEENPDLVEAHMGMGHIYRHHSQFKFASRSFEHATRLAPNLFEAQYYLGLMQQLTGKLQNAISTYLRALALKPKNPDVNNKLATTYMQLDRTNDAMPYAKQAIELNPNDQTAWANLATAYSLRGQNEKAVDAYRQAIELGEMAPPLLLGFSNALIQLQHYEQAINVLTSLNRQSPSPISLERLGYAQYKARRFDEAFKSFRATLIIDRHNIPAMNGLGVCLMTRYLQSGRLVPAQRNEAVALWKRSITLRPNQPRIIELLTRYNML